mmetsp:Transcript_37267/g.58146  ORF Transcript_37267/g.58146 Transcript_37267/m.58146 type:complete len:479 (-) Transcript_37267:564-2000(-)
MHRRRYLSCRWLPVRRAARQRHLDCPALLGHLAEPGHRLKRDARVRMGQPLHPALRLLWLRHAFQLGGDQHGGLGGPAVAHDGHRRRGLRPRPGFGGRGLGPRLLLPRHPALHALPGEFGGGRARGDVRPADERGRRRREFVRGGGRPHGPGSQAFLRGPGGVPGLAADPVPAAPGPAAPALLPPEPQPAVREGRHPADLRRRGRHADEPRGPVRRGDGVPGQHGAVLLLGVRPGDDHHGDRADPGRLLHRRALPVRLLCHRHVRGGHWAVHLRRVLRQFLGRQRGPLPVQGSARAPPVPPLPPLRGDAARAADDLPRRADDRAPGVPQRLPPLRDGPGRGGGVPRLRHLGVLRDAEPELRRHAAGAAADVCGGHRPEVARLRGLPVRRRGQPPLGRVFLLRGPAGDQLHALQRHRGLPHHVLRGGEEPVQVPGGPGQLPAGLRAVRRHGQGGHSRLPGPDPFPEHAGAALHPAAVRH